MHARIEPLIQSAGQLGALWDSVYLALREGGVSLKVANARLLGATLEEFDRRVATTLDAVAALSKLDEASQLMFLPRVEPVNTHLGTITRHLNQLLSELSPQPGATFQDPNGNLEPLQRFMSGAHTANINAVQLLESVQAPLAAVFDLTTSGVRLGRGQSTSLYFRYGEQLRNHMIEARSSAQDAKKKSEAAAISAGLLATKVEEAQKLVTALEEAVGEAQKDRSLVAAALDEAKAKLAGVREAAVGAASLQKQVTTYAAEFDSLQKVPDHDFGTTQLVH
ncbi:hypothetical protein [Hydrogenophaga sp. 2FB]|uniref:hypothetical protein n=1 Tax=Hydrogenophaga sp. 2FB TaxID=2502187 RepID=UPI0010F6124F|nr:hypothetical protein [Hydrogenophaga sp. 2FB]